VVGSPVALRRDDLAGMLSGAAARFLRSVRDQTSSPCASRSGEPRLYAAELAAAPGAAAGGDAGTGASTGPVVPFLVGEVPRSPHRHETPCRPDALTALLARALEVEPQGGSLRVLLVPEDPGDGPPWTGALARAVPGLDRRTVRRVTAPFRVALMAPEGSSASSPGEVRRLEALRDATHRAMRLVDLPASELTTETFLELARRRGAQLGASVDVVAGVRELQAQGLRGLAAVGRAARHPPAAIALGHPGAGALGAGSGWGIVGKGIVFDSGGLDLKRPAEMRGMKADMAGAAVALEAFTAAVELGLPGPLHAVLCLAENAIGPDALRPDDILELRSGLTVEVVDTDSEGRLALADGCSWLLGQRPLTGLVTLGTLTDAAPVATGRGHAAIVASDEALERRAVTAGRALGEPVHPLPFLPERARRALASEVADLANAPATPDAGVTVAAGFIGAHLGNYAGPWLHVDLEGTARALPGGRATGFGVGLLLGLLGAFGEPADAADGGKKG